MHLTDNVHCVVKHQLLGTVLALVSTIALSASVALAAGPTKVNAVASVTGGHGSGGGCSDAQVKATDTGASKPKKADSKDHGKPTKVHPVGEGNAGDRPENHGWFVSQAAKEHSLTDRAHGDAVSKVARGGEGKPQSANR